MSRLPASRVLAADLRVLWKGYDLAAAQEDWMRRLLVRLAKREEAVRRFVELPGVAWVRAATLFVWLDTPWRFASKAALWKYLGVGLERRHSGAGAERLRVPCGVNRLLKGTILGAAKSAAALGDNPFADLYRRGIDRGLSPRLARRKQGRPNHVSRDRSKPRGRGGRGPGEEEAQGLCGEVPRDCQHSGASVPADPEGRHPHVPGSRDSFGGHLQLDCDRSCLHRRRRQRSVSSGR